MPSPSDENAAVIRRAVQHLNATGDLAWDLYDADVVFVSRGELGGSNTFHGRDGLDRALQGFRSVWGDGMAFEVTDVLGGPDVFVALLHFHLRGEQSGVELETDEAWAVWLRDGTMTRIEQYGTRQEAAEAAGLPSSA